MSDTLASYCGEFCIDAQHASLPGHFPGYPVVPGVLLLEHIAAALDREYGLRVVTLTQVKFLHPLMPGQRAALRLQVRCMRVNFSIEYARQPIASGVIETGT